MTSRKTEQKGKKKQPAKTMTTTTTAATWANIRGWVVVVVSLNFALLIKHGWTRARGSLNHMENSGSYMIAKHQPPTTLLFRFRRMVVNSKTASGKKGGIFAKNRLLCLHLRKGFEELCVWSRNAEKPAHPSVFRLDERDCLSVTVFFSEKMPDILERI